MDVNISNWDRMLSNFADSALQMGIRIVMALVIYLVGRFVIKKLIRLISNGRGFKRIDATAAGYIVAFIKAVLYIVLAVSIIALLGVPMSSVIAVIASAGVAVGMAMQGALGNIAGGIMLLIFRPFSVGDYVITSAGEEGTVRSISLVYTVLTTIDNMRISVPNGSMMNASITNATAEPLRRVDLSFNITGDVPASKVQETILGSVAASGLVLAEPEAAVVVTEPVPGGLTYAVRVWTKTSDYWDLHNELMKEIPAALASEGIGGAATPVKVSGDR